MWVTLHMHVVGPNSNGITHVNKTSDRHEPAQCSLDTRAKEGPTLLLQSLKKCFASCFHIQTQNDRVHFCLAPGFLRNPHSRLLRSSIHPRPDTLRLGIWMGAFLCPLLGGRHSVALRSLSVEKGTCKRRDVWGMSQSGRGRSAAPLLASRDGSRFLPHALNLSFRTFWVMAVCTEVFAEHRCPRRRACSCIPSGHCPSPCHLHLGTKRKQNRTITALLSLGSESRPAGPLCLPWSKPGGHPSLSPPAQAQPAARRPWPRSRSGALGWARPPAAGRAPRRRRPAPSHPAASPCPPPRPTSLSPPEPRPEGGREARPGSSLRGCGAVRRGGLGPTGAAWRWVGAGGAWLWRERSQELSFWVGRGREESGCFFSVLVSQRLAQSLSPAARLGSCPWLSIYCSICSIFFLSTSSQLHEVS